MAQGAASQKLWIEVLTMAKKNNKKTSQKLWFDQTTWCHSFDKGGPKSHQRTSRCQGCTFLQEIIIPGKIYCRSFTGEILLQNLYIVGKKYCSSFTGEILPQNL